MCRDSIARTKHILDRVPLKTSLKILKVNGEGTSLHFTINHIVVASFEPSFALVSVSVVVLLSSYILLHLTCPDHPFYPPSSQVRLWLVGYYMRCWTLLLKTKTMTTSTESWYVTILLIWLCRFDKCLFWPHFELDLFHTHCALRTVYTKNL